MNKQNLFTLQVFQSLSRKCKGHLLQSCLKEFVRFICESIKNLLKENLQNIKRHHVAEFQSEVRLLSLNLEAKKKRSVVRKGIATNSRHFTSRH